jgi:hypothetical protein
VLVDQQPGFFASDCTHGQFQLVSAVATQGTQRIACAALRMNTQQLCIRGNLAQEKSYRSLNLSSAVANLPLESDGLKDPPLGGQSSAGNSSKYPGLCR